MKIAETRKNLKEILNVNLALKKHLACFNGDLIFSNGFLPKECGIALGCQQGSQLIAFFYEELRCYQLVIFAIDLEMSDPSRSAVRILDISEIYQTSKTDTIVTLLSHVADSSILANYTDGSASGENHFLVEIDLERLTRDFPRLVERLADAIVFLGEVLFAGGGK